jgi:drug/metabolite transporter (DMT)-like permease
MAKLSAPVAVLGVVVFGTAASLIAKLIYSVHGVNSHGEHVPFTKPWFQVLGMFVGMSVCVVLDLPRPVSTAAERAPLLDAGDAADGDDRPPTPWIINYPTLFDLFATACGTTGLLYTTVSVYQMLRGAQLVFTALLSIAFLGRRLTHYNYAGIALCMVGIVFVGLANVMGEDGAASRGDTVFGILVILAGQVLQASQVVLEEHLLQNLRMSSVRVVAWEGMFGAAHCLLWVFPVVYLLPGPDGGHLEDAWDAFYMLFHSWPIAAVILADMALMLAYNVCGMEVTNNLSAVSRVIIETLRTLFVWLCDLLLFYALSNGRLGEPWTPYSYLQAFGFCLTVSGTICYNYEHLSADYRRAKKVAAGSEDVAPATTITAAAVAAVAAAAAGASASPGAGKTKQMRATTVEDGLRPRVSRPLNVQADEDGDEYDSEDDEGVMVGSFLGSASHGSSFAGSSMPSSLRKRPVG